MIEEAPIDWAPFGEVSLGYASSFEPNVLVKERPFTEAPIDVSPFASHIVVKDATFGEAPLNKAPFTEAHIDESPFAADVVVKEATFATNKPVKEELFIEVSMVLYV